MPRLLQINVTANWGSTGKITEQIATSAQAHGWECITAYGRWANPSKYSTYKIGNKLDTYAHYLENRIFDREGLSSRLATKNLVRYIERLSPDVVSLHNIHDHYLNYRILFEYLNSVNIKVVWTFHDCWAITGHCMHFVTKNCERWITGCYDCPMKGEYPITFFDQSKRNWGLKKALFTANENLTLVACSDWIANFIHRSFLKDKRIEIIHNGIDLNVLKPIYPKINNSHKFKILAVSNVWYPNKGELDIYKLRTLLSECEYEITMVGLSVEQIKKLPSDINGIKRTQNIQELVQLYSDADVLINPTYEDNFPTVNIEALACGTPVITYRTGGSPEAIDDNTGAVIEQGDINALSRKIIEFKNIEFKQCHAIDCRRRAEEHFDKDKCFEKYIAIYESLL
jgi:glycosyltransferase involved in cell wall biosynthesis